MVSSPRDKVIGEPMERDLFREIVEGVDLPKNLIEQELRTLITGAGILPEHLSLEVLRKLMATYLQEVFLDAKADAKDGIVID